MPVGTINNGEAAVSVRGKLNALIAQSNSDNAQVAAQAGQISALQASDTAQGAAISALQASDTAQNANITALQASDTAQNAAITALQNAVKKDFKAVTVPAAFGTTSLSWVDVPGVTLTSGNLGGNGTYRVTASFTHFSSLSGGAGKEYRLVYGAGNTLIGIIKRMANSSGSVSAELMGKVSGIPAGTVFKLQVQRQPGAPAVTISTQDCTMHIEGVLDSNIIP